MDTASEQRLQFVMPALADKIRYLARLLETEGIEMRVTAGLRTVAQQDALYAQGRNGDTRPRVTNCPGGYSYHNFGLAVDCCPSQFGPDKPFTPDWNDSHPSWQRMIFLGVQLGLTSGANWRTIKDAPHLQLTGRFPEGAPSDELRAILQEKGIEAVWEAVAAPLGTAA